MDNLNCTACNNPLSNYMCLSCLNAPNNPKKYREVRIDHLASREERIRQIGKIQKRRLKDLQYECPGCIKITLANLCKKCEGIKDKKNWCLVCKNKRLFCRMCLKIRCESCISILYHGKCTKCIDKEHVKRFCSICNISVKTRICDHCEEKYVFSEYCNCIGTNKINICTYCQTIKQNLKTQSINFYHDKNKEDSAENCNGFLPTDKVGRKIITQYKSELYDIEGTMKIEDRTKNQNVLNLTDETLNSLQLFEKTIDLINLNNLHRTQQSSKEDVDESDLNVLDNTKNKQLLSYSFNNITENINLELKQSKHTNNEKDRKEMSKSVMLDPFISTQCFNKGKVEKDHLFNSKNSILLNNNSNALDITSNKIEKKTGLNITDSSEQANLASNYTNLYTEKCMSKESKKRNQNDSNSITQKFYCTETHHKAVLSPYSRSNSNLSCERCKNSQKTKFTIDFNNKSSIQVDDLCFLEKRTFSQPKLIEDIEKINQLTGQLKIHQEQNICMNYPISLEIKNKIFKLKSKETEVKKEIVISNRGKVNSLIKYFESLKD